MLWWLRKQTKLWISLALAILAIYVLWYLKGVAKEIYQYSLLDQVTQGKVEEVAIQEVDDGYALYVTYTYQVNGKLYTGSSVFHGNLSRSKIALEKSVETLKNQLLPIYFNKEDPEKASLENDFPFKHIIYVCILIGVWIYFFGLSRLLRNFK